MHEKIHDHRECLCASHAAWVVVECIGNDLLLDSDEYAEAGAR